MNEVFDQMAQGLAKKVEGVLLPVVTKLLDKFFRGGVKLTYTEEEAAELLQMSPDKLYRIRKEKRINYYAYFGKATYGLHHLQDFASRHEVVNVPSRFTLSDNVSLFGVESKAAADTKLRRVS